MAGSRLDARRAARSAAASVKAGLTTERVVHAALRMIDEEGGFEQFSMRRLARTLGVTPMALYSHVRDRDELLSRIGGVILAEIELPDASGPWPRRLRAICTSFRQTMRRHPTMAPFVTRALALHTPESHPVAEALLSALIDAGLRGEMLFSVYRSFIGAVSGFIQVESETRAATGHGPDVEGNAAETAVDMAERVLGGKALDPSSAVVTPPSGDAEFDALVQLLVSGVEAVLGARD